MYACTRVGMCLRAQSGFPPTHSHSCLSTAPHITSPPCHHSKTGGLRCVSTQSSLMWQTFAHTATLVCRTLFLQSWNCGYRNYRISQHKTNLLLNMDYHRSDRYLTGSLLSRERATFNWGAQSQEVSNVWNHTYVTLKTLLPPPNNASIMKQLPRNGGKAGKKTTKLIT